MHEYIMLYTIKRHSLVCTKDNKSQDRNASLTLNNYILGTENNKFNFSEYIKQIDVNQGLFQQNKYI